MVPSAIRDLALYDAALMYRSAMEKDRDQWHRTSIISQSLGGGLKLSDVYRTAESPSHRRTQVSKREEQKRLTKGFAHWLEHRRN